MGKKKIWARVGMTFEVDEQAFLDNPERELARALREEDLRLDGETYIPENVLDEYGFPSDREVGVDM